MKPIKQYIDEQTKDCPLTEKQEFVERDFYFNVIAVTSCFLNNDQNINVILGGMPMTFKYEKRLFWRILSWLNEGKIIQDAEDMPTTDEVQKSKIKKHEV